MKRNKTLFINLYSGPGSGKSSSALGVTFNLKSRSYNAEYISEVAKQKVWSEDFKSLGCQPYITGKQLYKQWIVDGKVDYAVTDSPLLLGLFYSGFGCNEDWEKSILHQFGLFDNLNILLKRNLDAHPFEQAGRMQNLEECLVIDQKIKDLLDNHSIPYVELEVSENCKHVEEILRLATGVEWKI